jgi:Histidine kinase-, DNA gyrase B-, and HSP90-like ATPase
LDVKTTPIEGIEAQRVLIQHLEESKFGWDIVVGDAFVRGMRDIGYKNTAYALCELIDNSIQASAKHIDLVFGFDNSSKPNKLAIVDDGHGMEPKMVRAALVWGAGTRANNRDGFGKYGYGLPSASVSQARRVTVYSKTAEGAWHSAHLDVDEISEGKWSAGHRIEMPHEKAEQPPKFVFDELKKLGRDLLSNGTVVVWENIDRVDLRQRDALRAKLLTDLGVIYRNYLVATPITVDGTDVEPCDPLFLTPGFRYYDIDDDRAIEMAPAVVEIKDRDSDRIVGKMRVRYSRLPATFFRTPDAKRTNKPGKKQINERLAVADANNGIIFLRNGRQIDVVRPPRGMNFQINATTDRYWGIEVDFDASLDDYFAITTSKQQVKPDDRIWDMLKDKAGVLTSVANMRSDYEKDAKQIALAAEADKKRASIEAIEDAKKFRTSKPPQETPERRKEAEGNLRREVEKRAKNSGVNPEVIEKELVAKQEGNEFAVETEDLPGAPFFRTEQRGGQKVLLLNVAHRFYMDLYMGAGTSPRLRAGLEVLLWTLGIAEVEADPDSDRRRFYERERGSVWSPYLADALTSLGRIEIVAEAEVSDEAA